MTELKEYTVGGTAHSRATNYVPNIDHLGDVAPFYIEYGSPRPKLVQVLSAHVDRSFVPVLQCHSFDDEGARNYRLDKITAVLDQKGVEQPISTFWLKTLGVTWPAT